jgi:hypothetical protein
MIPGEEPVEDMPADDMGGEDVEEIDITDLVNNDSKH